MRLSSARVETHRYRLLKKTQEASIPFHLIKLRQHAEQHDRNYRGGIGR
ncbi:hypothetical protein [Murinocardiopsis flavida]|nr:hypothetical protein [Murinocardiopsis flavida]